VGVADIDKTNVLAYFSVAYFNSYKNIVQAQAVLYDTTRHCANVAYIVKLPVFNPIKIYTPVTASLLHL